MGGKIPETLGRHLRVAVYAIARNEAAFAQRFMASVADADEVWIADTGSTDGTPEVFESLGANVVSIRVLPWRFDDARNAALARLPENIDVCVSLDCDEVMLADWRTWLESAWIPGTTRLRYTSIYSWTVDHQPNLKFVNDRIHARGGYRWRHPIHESVEYCGTEQEQVAFCEPLEVHHYPDSTKSRANYLPMLKRAVLEDPASPRMAYYFGRELYFTENYDNAIRELIRYLALPCAYWNEQRADACRMIARCFDAKGANEEAMTWRWKCVMECPNQREAWVDLSLALYLQCDYAGGYFAAKRALSLDAMSGAHVSRGESRGALPHDLLSNCAWQLGLISEAKTHAVLAAELDQHDARLRDNVAFLEKLPLELPR